MDNIIYLIFRRMRVPLLVLLVAYSIAVLGLVLIPGEDANGNPWHMGFFHAFYFVSFMATTIGFGEIPYEFTDAQRMWVLYSIYSTVIVWIYAIGNLLTLFQDHTFRQAMVERQFARRIKHLREEFYIICGYGETGRALVCDLTERDQHAVVVDIDENRVNLLSLENLRQYVPGLSADAARPLHLQEAGLEHPLCAGVVALTNVNEVNLKIALTSKLLRPKLKVICRADSHDIEKNMASFGTDYIIDPFDTFARHLAIALQAPGLHQLQNWLTAISDTERAEPIKPPNKGLWVLCGYGRFGKALYQRLKSEGLEVIVVEAVPDVTGEPVEGCIKGRGTEADTLQEAQIERAVGLVAGTNDDTNNLSIIMTAKKMNSDLFIVARQNNIDNKAIFDAVKADMIMHDSSIIANKVRVLLGTPLLFEFISLAQHENDAWASVLIQRIAALGGSVVPEIWEICINEEQAPAVVDTLSKGRLVTLQQLIQDPRDRDRSLPSLPLMRISQNTRDLMPVLSTELKLGDKLLFCGLYCAEYRMRWILQHPYSLAYILTGDAQPQGKIWKLLNRFTSQNDNQSA